MPADYLLIGKFPNSLTPNSHTKLRAARPSATRRAEAIAVRNLRGWQGIIIE
jgi:hypothetical protein